MLHLNKVFGLLKSSIVDNYLRSLDNNGFQISSEECFIPEHWIYWCEGSIVWRRGSRRGI